MASDTAAYESFLSTCLALDVDVCFASLLFKNYMRPFILVPLASRLRIIFKVITIKDGHLFYFPFFSPYAALFLSRDSGCKNTLI